MATFYILLTLLIPNCKTEWWDAGEGALHYLLNQYPSHVTMATFYILLTYCTNASSISLCNHGNILCITYCKDTPHNLYVTMATFHIYDLLYQYSLQLPCSHGNSLYTSYSTNNTSNHPVTMVPISPPNYLITMTCLYIPYTVTDIFPSSHHVTMAPFSIRYYFQYSSQSPCTQVQFRYTTHDSNTPP